MGQNKGQLTLILNPTQQPHRNNHHPIARSISIYLIGFQYIKSQRFHQIPSIIRRQQFLSNRFNKVRHWVAIQNSARHQQIINRKHTFDQMLLFQSRLFPPQLLVFQFTHRIIHFFHRRYFEIDGQFTRANRAPIMFKIYLHIGITSLGKQRLSTQTQQAYQQDPHRNSLSHI